MKEFVVELLAKEIKLKKEEIENLIEIPPSSELGDYAFPCFSLAKQEKKSPLLIAENLAEKFRKELPKEISGVSAKSGYVNFFINKNFLVERALKQVLDFNPKKIKKKGIKKRIKKIMVEFPSPNTNKPLHLGHLRNMSIGEGVSRILEFSGNKVIRTSLNNDRGVHICKSMIAYDKFGKGMTPEKSGKKPDHFVGDYYVLFSQKLKDNPELEKEVQECLVKWEKGDRKTMELWKKMNSWALTGFKETYKLFGIKHDKEYFESQIYEKGKEIVALGLKKRIFEKRKDNAVIINISKQGNENFGEKVLLRPDGTSIYITQDLYLAKLKDGQYHLDGSIYVVGNEQEYHFKVLFYILKKLGFKFAKNLHHLSYGMVELPEGRMKSREGRVIDADDLIIETQNLAKEELKKRYNLAKEELNARSLKIALAAIKFDLLRVDIKKNMVFNPDEAISFEGDTGPYLLYSYARACSILKKLKKSGKLQNQKIAELKEEEINLIKHLSAFNSVFEKATRELSPSIIANYALELAHCFNDFYHNCPVLKSQEQAFRLRIVRAFRIVMKTCLNLMGIGELEEM